MTATDVINYQGLPSAATPCHKFPDHQLVDPLLSLGKLATHGCHITFVGDKVTVTNPDGKIVLVGRKPRHRNVYTVPLPIGRPSPPPSIVCHTPASKISGIPKQNLTQSETTKDSVPMAQTTQKENRVPLQPRKSVNNDILLAQKHKNSHNSANNGVRGKLRADLETTALPY